MSLVIVLSLAHIEVALVADVLMLIIASVGRRRMPTLVSPSVMRVWNPLVTNFKRLLGAGLAIWVLLFFFDHRAAVTLLQGSIVVLLFALFVLLIWGGIIGLVVAVSTLIIGMTYKQARRTMNDYRHQVGGQDRAGSTWSGYQSYTGNGSTVTYTPFEVEYRVLGLCGNESPEAVKRKWREGVARLHPDHRQGQTSAERESAQEQLKYVNAAYTVLKKNGLAA